MASSSIEFDVESAPALSKALFSKDKSAHKDILKEAKKNAALLSQEDKDNRLPIHYASYSGNEKAIDFFIKKKSDLNQPDKIQNTPLHYAAMGGHLRICRHLIQSGADANALNELGRSPLHYLAQIQVDPLKSKLVEDYNKTLHALLEVGAGDVNQIDIDGRTPIHVASKSGSIVALQFLLRSEGDVHRKTRWGQTPLFYAVENQNIEIVKLLLEAGADPSAYSDNGTCFDIAPAGNDELFELLDSYREKNRRCDSEFEYRACYNNKNVTIIKNPREIENERLVKMSGLLEDSPDLVAENLDTFVYLLSFLTKKLYRTTGQQALAELKSAEESESDGSSSARSHHSYHSHSYSGMHSHHSTQSSMSRYKTKTIETFSLPEAAIGLIDNGNPRKMFKVFDETGHGAYGTVHRAKAIAWRFHGFKVTKGNHVAIKRVQHTSDKEKWNNYDEVYFLKNCHHPCIVPFLHAYHSKYEVWIVMEYLEGGSLQEAVNQERFKECHIRYITKRILQALQYLHERNFAHRDLKSANVMLSLEGDVKLIDFGLCVDVRTGPLTNMCGSPFWMPPEMIRREEHSLSCDIWSLGMLVMEMARSIPNRHSALRAMFLIGAGQIPTLKHESKWSSDMKDFLSRVLVLNPAERGTAAELLQHPFVKENADDLMSIREVMGHAFIQKSLEVSLQL